MHLTETGESRVNGYLFILERSLKTFLPPDVVGDAVREIEVFVATHRAARRSLSRWRERRALARTGRFVA